MNLIRFVALIGSLIFVHELGHFLAAKILGVKVLKFSLGFGPRLIGFRRRDTDYCISLIPFGGFVKMLGEDPSDRVNPADTARSFNAQSLWRRSVIVLAGPLMSLVFPLILYFVVFLGQSMLSPPLVGTVVRGHPADGKLLPGDWVLSIDGREVESFQDVRERIAASPGRALKVRVLRELDPLELAAQEARERAAGVPPLAGWTRWLKTRRLVDVQITPASVRVDRPLGVVENVGFAGLSAGFPLAIIAVPLRDQPSPATRAGLRTFDVVTSVGGRPITRFVELETALRATHGATVPVSFLRARDAAPSVGGLVDVFEVLDPALVQITPDPGDADIFTRAGVASPDLYVADVPNHSAEHDMGLRRGDEILSVDGQVPASWESFRQTVLSGGETLHTVRFRQRDGSVKEGAFTLHPVMYTDEVGQQYRRVSFRTDHWQPTVSEPEIPNPSRILYAARHAWRETREALSFLSLSVVRILQGRVPLTTVGGPIMIYDVTSTTARDGLWGFLWLMALVSANLGLLNLLPIPILDGGHLFFFLIEGVTRRPVPLRVRQAASVVGLVLLGAIMVLAMRNDLQRKLGRAPAGPSISAAP